MSSRIRIRRVKANPASKPIKRTCHVLPRSPVIDLNGPGRLRTAHVLAIAGISHSTLYARMKSGAFPQPDGQDGGLNYWNTNTIRVYLEKPASNNASSK